MNKTLKIEFYDTFKCIADKCSFTCCKGWDISVDSDTYNKWKSNSRQIEFCNNIKVTKGKETNYSFKMGPHKSCPFLNEKDLCNIVIQHGEDYLSNTCKTFPRLENDFAGLKEHSLSCACPEVVNILSDINNNLQFSYNGSRYHLADIPFADISFTDIRFTNIRFADISLPNNTLFTSNITTSFQTRETMIAIIQNQTFSLKYRLLLVFHMLLCMKDNNSISNDITYKYQNQEHLLSVIDSLSTIPVNSEDTCFELNELFLDIVLNYKKEKHYRYYLKDISDLAEEIIIEDNLTEWDTFHKYFNQYDKLIENCIVSKIFSNCISDNIDELIMSFQMIITQYIMLQYSSFLSWILNDMKSIDYKEIRNYIVIYTRIIEYNVDGMIEFWEDSFDDAIWNFGYMLLITH